MAIYLLNEAITPEQQEWLIRMEESGFKRSKKFRLALLSMYKNILIPVNAKIVDKVTKQDLMEFYNLTEDEVRFVALHYVLDMKP